VSGTGQTTGKGLNVSGTPLDGNVLTVSAATPTFTPTSTATYLPAHHIVVFGPIPEVVAGGGAVPVTLEIQNSVGSPAHLPTDLLVSLSVDSPGDWSFNGDPPGMVSRVTVPAGSDARVVVTYEGARAGTWTLTASAPGLVTGTGLLTVTAGPAARLQVLWPGEWPDPGRPLSNPSGVLGSPNPVSAGAEVNAVIRVVDSYFNLTSSSASATFALSDATAPPPAPVSFVGSGLVPVRFYQTGNWHLTAGDPNGILAGYVTSDITVTTSADSTLLNVTHTSPVLTTMVRGQSGVTVMTFDLTVTAGGHAIQPESILFAAESAEGAPVALNTAFARWILVSSTGQAVTLDTSAISASSELFPLGAGLFVVEAVPSPPPPVTRLFLIADISPGADARSVRLTLNGPATVPMPLPAVDTVTGNPVGVASVGDSTGFPMRSSVLHLRAGDLASTYGNYPNPFHPGLQSTIFEFYLPSSGAVDLSIYDVTGRLVRRLLAGDTLPAGLRRFPWDGRNGMGLDLANGVYFARLTVGGSSHILKVAVTR
jgi:hypothetical protein